MEMFYFLTFYLAILSSSFASNLSSCSNHVKCRLEVSPNCAAVKEKQPFISYRWNPIDSGLNIEYWKDDNYTYLEIEWQAQHNQGDFLIKTRAVFEEDSWSERRLGNISCFRVKILDNQTYYWQESNSIPFHIRNLRLSHERELHFYVSLYRNIFTQNEVEPTREHIDVAISKGPGWDFKLQRWTDESGSHHFRIRNPFPEAYYYTVQLLDLPDLNPFRKETFLNYEKGRVYENEGAITIPDPENLPHFLISNVSRKMYAVRIFVFGRPGTSGSTIYLRHFNFLRYDTTNSMIFPGKLNFTDTTIEEKEALNKNITDIVNNTDVQRVENTNSSVRFHNGSQIISLSWNCLLILIIFGAVTRKCAFLRNETHFEVQRAFC